MAHTNALAKALSGGKVEGKSAEKALDGAVKKIQTLTTRASTYKENAVRVAGHAIHSAETLGSLFAGSLAEGYLGEDKLKVGGVDLRLAGGLVGAAYGLYEVFNNKDAGEHVLALSNGLIGSALAPMAVKAGQKLAARPPAAPTPAGTPTAAVSGLLQAPRVAGPVREITYQRRPGAPAAYVTPEANVAGTPRINPFRAG